MTHLPDFETFARLAREGDVVPVYRQLVSDTLTPVSAYCKIQDGSHSFLFESVVGGEKIGRYSFLGSNPFLELKAFDRTVYRVQKNEERRWVSEDPLLDLQKELNQFKGVHVPGLPRFCGGAVGFFCIPR